MAQAPAPPFSHLLLLLGLLLLRRLVCYLLSACCCPSCNGKLTAPLPQRRTPGLTLRLLQTSPAPAPVPAASPTAPHLADESLCRANFVATAPGFKCKPLHCVLSRSHFQLQQQQLLHQLWPLCQLQLSRSLSLPGLTSVCLCHVTLCAEHLNYYEPASLTA